MCIISIYFTMPPNLTPAPYSLFLFLNIIVSYIQSNRNKTYVVHLVWLTWICANHLVLGNLLGAHIWGRLNLSFLLIINCLLFLVEGGAWQHSRRPSVLLCLLVLLLLRSCRYRGRGNKETLCEGCLQTRVLARFMLNLTQALVI